MIKVASEADRVLVAKLNEAGQAQVFDFWDRLRPEEQSALLAELHSIDLPLVKRLIAESQKGAQAPCEARVLNAAPFLPLPRSEEDLALEREARAAGEEALRKGEVAILTAAGEVRGRKGTEEPRGLLPVGPVSGKSLLCLHAQRIRALGRRYRSSIPWIVATTPDSEEAVIRHFRENEHFGLNRAEVIFITQDELPVVNRRGKILLSELGQVAMSPTGHGGVLMKLLAQEEAFQALEVRGVAHLSYFQVDNALARIADPVLIGHHILGGHELTSKGVPRLEVEERVGVFCQWNGCLGVVEHRELSGTDRGRRKPDGALVLSLASIATHVFSMELLRRLRAERVELPYHFVEARTPSIDRKGNRVTPRSANSVQFECFVFDALPLARSALVVEGRREEEFSPVKGLEGADSLSTARRDISRLHARWLAEAGSASPRGPGGEERLVEISPLFALDIEELRAKLKEPLGVAGSLYLE